jgi:hypothetical protein
MTQTALTQSIPRAARRASAAPTELPSYPAASPASLQRPRRALPAALKWEDTSLPGLGRVRAAGWAPAVLLASCAVALMYLAQTSGVATTGYDIQRLQSERSEWMLRNEQLKLELAKLRSLAWVESEAVRRLGMQRAESVTYLRATSSPSVQ